MMTRYDATVVVVMMIIIKHSGAKDRIATYTSIYNYIIYKSK